MVNMIAVASRSIRFMSGSPLTSPFKHRSRSFGSTVRSYSGYKVRSNCWYWGLSVGEMLDGC